MTVKEDYLDSFDWWGFGITDADGTMDHFDVYMIYKDGTGDNRVVDSWAPSAGAIFTDSINSITVESHERSGGDFVSKFKRALQTADTEDEQLEEDKTFRMLLAAGKFESNGYTAA